MRIAIRNGNVVDNVIDAGSIEAVSTAHPLPAGWEYIDGTGLNPGDVRDGPGQPWHALVPVSPIASWCPLATFIARFDALLPRIEATILGDATHPPEPELAVLKTRLLATSAENPGYVNLQAAELSAGLSELVTRWGTRIDMTQADIPALLE